MSILKVVFLSVLLGIGSNLFPQCKIMTFNIRYDNPNDGANSWENRKEELADLIKSYHPDIFGLQEGLAHQLKFITEKLPDYSMIGVGREDGKNKGEFSAIFFDKQKFNLLKEATFWLSEKGDTGSTGWDAALPRICTYGLFEEIKTARRIWAFNAHYDHKGKTAREKSSRLILDKINEVNKENYPVVLLGDFNSTPESKAIKILETGLKDGMKISREKFAGKKGTFNGFADDDVLKDRIDFIFVKNLKVVSYKHLTDKRKNGKWISDHLPVLIEVE